MVTLAQEVPPVQRTATKDGVGIAAYELDWKKPEDMNDDKLIDFVINQYSAGKRRRSNWEQKAMTQLAWAEGDQSKEYDVERNDLIERVERAIPMAYQQPVEINSIKGFIVQRIAMLLGQPAILIATPATNEDADVNGARLQTKLLQYMWLTGDESIRTQLIWALWMMFATGLMFIHPYWDPFAGKKDQFGPKTDDEGDKVKNDKKIKNFKQLVAMLRGRSVDDLMFDNKGNIDIEPGEVRWSFRTGFDITEPEYANSVKESAWLIDTQWRSMEYMLFRYGKKAKAINPTSDTQQYLAGYRSTYDPNVQRPGESDHTVRAEIVEVHTLWRPRSPWCPNGARIVISDKLVMYKGKNPYPHGEIPIIAMQEMPSHRFRPRSTVHNMMKLQEARNRMRSQMAAHIHETIAPKIIHEKGCQFPDNAFDSQDRQIEVPNDMLDKVKAWEPPDLAREVFLMDGILRADLQDVSAVHDSTSGRGESKQQSGRHAAILVQSDSRAALVARELLEGALSKAGAQSLWLWYKFVPVERSITISGGEFGPEVLSFKGSQLLGSGGEPGPADFNVRVQLGTDNQPEQVIAKITAMTEMGYWNPANPADRQRVSRLLGEQLIVDHDDESRNRRNANAEHQLFKNNRDVRVALGDDDELHLNEHYKWTTTAEYRAAVAKETSSTAEADRIDFKIQVHLREHMRQRANKIIVPEIINRHELERLKNEMEMQFGPNSSINEMLEKLNAGNGKAPARIAQPPTQQAATSVATSQ